MTRLDNWWAKDEKTSKNLYNFDRITISVVKDNEALMYEKFKKGESDFYQVTKPSRWTQRSCPISRSLTFYKRFIKNL